MFNARQLTLFGNSLRRINCNSLFSSKSPVKSKLSPVPSAAASQICSSSSNRCLHQNQRALVYVNKNNCHNFARESITQLPFQVSKNCLTTEKHFSSSTKSSEEDRRIMTYFVIGVSGVTCGGKTTLTKLLQKSFPWSRVIHQDKYFYPDDYLGHARIPEVENHVHYDLIQALDMDRMHRDVAAILDTPPALKNGTTNGVHNGDVTPNFEGLHWIQDLQELNIDVSKYAGVPILILEGFMLFESEVLYKHCDVRFFLTLDEETCRARRSLRNFDPPDCEGYFDHCIWPAYQDHYKKFIENRDGIYSFSGKSNVHKLWKDSVEIVTHKMEDKFSYKLQVNRNGF